MRSSLEARALAAIEQHGALLVYPIENRRDPPSLWFALHPRSAMRWAWDQDADPRVVSLWHLRAEVTRSRRAVYTKWYRGRALFVARPLFQAMLAAVAPWERTYPREAEEILALLEEDSPRSSRRLRADAGLGGRCGERTWMRAMRELWSALAVVGTGEVDDGAFPSLEVGATRWIFEELWDAARASPPTREGAALLARAFAPTTALGKHWRKLHGHGAGGAACG